MLKSSWLFVGRFVRSLGRTGYRLGGQNMNAEHRAILAALEARDPKAARAAMIAHIDGSERRVFKGER
ncbi:FCD domain-containing protein [Palleronia sp. THAF1]|uniref:FCD domain-containing protein n=1 Tax=Palleronia sp. THAF1 TaxID=2587842 RepID=UPI0015626859|nr:FCD domain-containing protein [Palleronia sp. THAF1]